MSTEVLVAMILTVGTVLAAGFGALATYLQRLNATLGTKNGNGDVVAMMTQLLRGQTGQDSRLASLDRHATRMESRMDLADLERAALRRAVEYQTDVDQLARDGQTDRRHA